MANRRTGSSIRLRYTINTHPEDQEIATQRRSAPPPALPLTEPVRLLSRWQWREGDLPALQPVADRLGLQVGLAELDLLAGRAGDR